MIYDILFFLVLMPIVALFTVINIAVGCYLTIRLGFGPPNWQTALNLVVPVTTLQDWLNEGRAWLDMRAPWADKFLDRLHIPKPIIIVYHVDEEEAIEDVVVKNEIEEDKIDAEEGETDKEEDKIDADEEEVGVP